MGNKIKSFLNLVEVHLMVILMVIFMVNIFLQIFLRVLFNYPLFFAEELSRYAFLWMVFLGLSYATLHDKHIRVSIVVNLLPEKIQTAIDIIIQIFTIAAFVWIFVTSLKYFVFCGNAVTSAMRIPKKMVSLILPFSSILVIIRCIQKIWGDIGSFVEKGGSI